MYQALYRTWRPKTFDEVIGQPSVSQTLKAQVDSGRLSHAYLFTGTRGTGKTTCARILAKAVNCLHPKDGNPCNQCAHCKSIDDGSSLDVLEIDAASNTGVDNIRTLREEANYTPSELRKRVYIIDEVHMLSNQAFNALLKIIEEPPEHLIFILATTELNKVPATILSRCQRYSFRRLSQQDLAGRINEVAYAEGIDIDAGATRLLARLGDGAMRDALSLLDQCASAVGSQPLTAERAYEILGLVGQKQTARMMQAIIGRRSDEALRLFDQLYQAGKSISSMLDELCMLARDLLLLKTVPGGGEDLLCGVCGMDECQALLPQVGAGELSYAIRRLQQTSSGFSQSVNPRLEAELCLLELCNPQLRLDADALHARLSHVEQQLVSGMIPAVSGPKQSPTGASEEDDLPPWEDALVPPDPAESSDLPAQPSQEIPMTPAAGDNFWPQLSEAVRPGLKPQVKGFFAVNGPIRCQVQGDLVILRTDEFTLKMINTPAVLETVGKAASALLGRPVQAKAELAGQSADKNDGFERFMARAKELDGGSGLIRFS